MPDCPSSRILWIKIMKFKTQKLRLYYLINQWLIKKKMKYKNSIYMFEVEKKNTKKEEEKHA